MSRNRKKLLNENTIRRMMKLAEIDSLSETFITDKLTVNEEDDFELDEPGMEEEPEVELPPEPEEEAPVEGGAEEMAMEFAQALAGVAERFGVDMDVQGAGEEEAAPEEEFPEEPAEEEFPEEGGEEMPPGGRDVYENLEDENVELKEEEDDDLKEDADDADLKEDDDDADLKEDDDENLEERLTAEIARRVAARLVKESRQDKMADQLAERIMARLTTKK